MLYRNNPTGEPNDIKQDIDLNGFNLLNVGKVYSDDGEWATVTEVVAIRDAVEADRAEVADNTLGVTNLKNSVELTANILQRYMIRLRISILEPFRARLPRLNQHN